MRPLTLHPRIRSRFGAIAGGLAMMALAMPSDLPGQTAEAAPEIVPGAPGDGGPRRWVVAAGTGLPIHASADDGAAIIGTAAPGAILLNHGCMRAGSRLWCAVQPLRSRLRGHVDGAVLRPARGPDGTVPMGIDDSLARARAGTFDGEIAIPCAQSPGQPLGRCTAAIARGTGGDATVVVIFSNGFRRMLSFAHGVFIRADTTMSGTGFDSDWWLEDGRHVIRVDDQRFEIPAAALSAP